MTMPFITSLLTALFMMCVVFLVLVLLWAILRILGVIFLGMEKSKAVNANTNGVQPGQQV